MKRAFIFILAIVFTVLCAYVGITNVKPVDNTQKILQFKKIVEKQESRGAYGRAIECQLEVVSLAPTCDNYLKLMNLYFANGDDSNGVRLCKEIEILFPKSGDAYAKLAEYYYSTGAYQKCVDECLKANNYNLLTDDMREMYNNCIYKCKFAIKSFDEIKGFLNGYAVAYNGDTYGLINPSGNTIVKFIYDDISYVNDLGVLGVLENGKASFIKTDGTTYVQTDEEYVSLLPFEGGRAKAVTADGKVYYVNRNGENKLGPYEDGTAFGDGIAVVKTEEGWKIIDINGKPVIKTVFAGVKTDEFGRACVNERMFINYGGLFYLVNKDGKMLSNTGYEDVRPFSTGDYAPVYKDGLWTFIDREGKEIMEPKYADAGAFSGKLAPVKDTETGLWGYIDKKGVVRIDFEFEDARAFSDDGNTAVVKKDGRWYILNKVLSQ